MKHSYNFIDLSNKKFGRLTVLKLAKPRKNRTFWVCKCKCGKTTEVEAYALKNGGVKSCGCLKKELTAKLNTKMFKTHGMSKTRFFRIWLHMRNRCQNPNNQAYKRYGNRGIKVCNKWNKFENFKSDMYVDYLKHCAKFSKKQTTIDRINNNGNYCKSNCRWTTYKMQMKNKIYNRELLSKAGKLGAIARWGK